MRIYLAHSCGCSSQLSGRNFFEEDGSPHKLEAEQQRQQARADQQLVQQLRERTRMEAKRSAAPPDARAAVGRPRARLPMAFDTDSGE